MALITSDIHVARRGREALTSKPAANGCITSQMANKSATLISSPVGVSEEVKTGEVGGKKEGGERESERLIET